MPLYEYECTSCHRRTEKIQKFSDPELTVCPHCGGPLERTITAAAVSFKGGGWYKDLYSSAKPAAPSTEASDAKSGGSTNASAASGDASSGGKVDSVSASAASSAAAKPSESAKPAPAPAAPSSAKS